MDSALVPAAILIFCGLVAGYLVNFVADAAPEWHPLRPWWLAPFSQRPPAAAERRRRHILVYAASFVLTILAWRAWGLAWGALIAAAYSWFFLAVAVIDLEHRRVLDRMLAPAAVMALVLSLAMGAPRPAAALLGAALGFLVFLVLRLLYPRGMGMGDVKLAGVIGLVTGLPAVVPALGIGMLAGGVAAVVLLLHHGRRRGQTLAYAPYLALGAWCVLLLGPLLAGTAG
jgi:leader peptidase (prepilin peptidase) / N-methyltransferase